MAGNPGTLILRGLTENLDQAKRQHR